MARFLIVEARFYAAISDAMAAGAVLELEKAGAEYDRIEVPGALEIPATIAMAAHMSDNMDVNVAAYITNRMTGADSPEFIQAYDGFIALGCVIRGETYHFEVVSRLSAQGLMDLAIKNRLAIGNGILTAENEEQAWERADPGRKNKGGEAARAALIMVEHARKFRGDS